MGNTITALSDYIGATVRISGAVEVGLYGQDTEGGAHFHQRQTVILEPSEALAMLAFLEEHKPEIQAVHEDDLRYQEQIKARAVAQ
jgi:hypothetical protein